MTKQEYDEALTELMGRYRKEVAELQERYADEYNAFKVGDLCRDQTGFRTYFVVKKIRHISNQGEIYTLLDGVTTNKHGEEHYGSRKDAFRDSTVKLIARS